MTTTFLGHNVWPRLRKAIAKSKKPCAVAVAYLGKGGADLLKLPKRSRLVVDASEPAVLSGQTSPAELRKFLPGDVRVYSSPNLHAKVFVLPKTAYVGSNNVSKHSANHLIEAALQITDPHAVAAARQFVIAHCLYRLTPTVLTKLQKIYRPPKFPGGKPGNKPSPTTPLPRIQVASLAESGWTDDEQKLHDAGLPAAKKRRKHPKLYQMDEFIWYGKCRFQEDDIVVQVTDTEQGTTLVSPPGNVIYTRSKKHGNRRTSCIYLERPTSKRRPLSKLAKELGYGAKKRLQKTCVIRDSIFAHKLLNSWSNSTD